ncbi:Gfo/Idh/MocA family oxidoreductase [Rhodobacteraceae bacterium HSP-20]|uniref:Gfo/Idh/MocA family oxidoreductase n=1 Tax=Paragemmobacter amnigenus TaxID=2852097 RepID=A0ABS6J4D2_9RHOB|nr:Gfo/Idh/MocA family oxidoreductase [Rhodobacter amnigenus]MBU9698619.1 Gfo/Idh/MocA family oxidoreductase [Rhodobacter amnigenus]MBV4389846.1 Gfo/Idh/MocA family oxidoreductase [Rhodobacter amnigenus]
MTHRGVLIGCGFFARNHMAAWAELEGVEIVAVCDTDAAKAAAYARDFGIARWGTDAAALLAEIRPDFVDIATTVGSHRALVELAAGHARLVICQKPFAETVEDAAAMVAACAETGAMLAVHENFRWQRPIREVKALVRAGAIGVPRWLRLSFRHGYDIYANQPYLAGVRDLALTDIGLHLFDMVRDLMGDIDRLSCEVQRRNPRVAGFDAFQALLRHHSGAVSTVECSFHSVLSPDPFPQSLLQIEGDGGSIEVTAGFRLRLHRAEGVEERDVEPPCPVWGERPWHLIQDSVLAFQRQAVAALDGCGTVEPSGAHNLGTLAAVLAAIRAAERGTVERV